MNEKQQTIKADTKKIIEAKEKSLNAWEKRNQPMWEQLAQRALGNVSNKRR